VPGTSIRRAPPVSWPNSTRATPFPCISARCGRSAWNRFHRPGAEFAMHATRLGVACSVRELQPGETARFDLPDRASDDVTTGAAIADAKDGHR
jgi:hypothetical protein